MKKFIKLSIIAILLGCGQPKETKLTGKEVLMYIDTTQGEKRIILAGKTLSYKYKNKEVAYYACFAKGSEMPCDSIKLILIDSAGYEALSY